MELPPQVFGWKGLELRREIWSGERDLGVCGMIEPPRMSGQGGHPAEDLPLGEAGRSWVQGVSLLWGEGAWGTQTPSQCVSRVVSRRSNQDHAYWRPPNKRSGTKNMQKRKFPRITQLLEITHRKCEMVLQVPCLPHSPGKTLVSCTPLPDWAWYLLLAMPWAPVILKEGHCAQCFMLSLRCLDKLEK